MNSSLIAISTLIKSNIGEKCLASFLINVSNQGLRDYLKLASIYNSDAIKQKTDLIGMIIYGCTSNKLNKEKIEDISPKHANQLLKRNGIIVESLPGYGNAGLKEKDMKPVNCDGWSNNKKTSINVID